MEKGAEPSTSSSSHYVKTVVLKDWWLVVAGKECGGRTLCVSGMPDEERAVRVFHSAPIVKRLSIFALETVDGVYVLLRGFINKKRTTESGFPPEVFKDFLYGFPINWEKYDVKHMEDDVYSTSPSNQNKTSVNGCMLDDTSKFSENLSTQSKFDTGALRVNNTPRINGADVVSNIVNLTGRKTSNLPCNADVCEETPLKVKKKQATSKKGYTSNVVTADDSSKRSEFFSKPAKVCVESALKLMKKQAVREKGPRSNVIIADDLFKMPDKIANPVDVDIHAVNSTHTSRDCEMEIIKNTTSKKRSMKGSMHCETDASSKIPMKSKSKKSSKREQLDASAATVDDTLENTGTYPKPIESSPIEKGIERSPVSLSGISDSKKSRSGRLLLRPLQFWRNEKAVYDRSRQITGIERPTIEPESGGGSTTKTKKRRSEDTPA